MWRAVRMACCVVWMSPALSWADGPRAAPGVWLCAWSFDPLILCTLGAMAWLYGRGWSRLRLTSGKQHAWVRWRAVSYFAALSIAALALVSPIDAMSEQLASMHMVQHMLLMTLAPLLLVLGAPVIVLAWGLAGIWRSPLAPLARHIFQLAQATLVWQAWAAWLLFGVTLWAWHHPVLYQAALHDPLLHDAQHLSFFVAGCLFWRVAIGACSRRGLHPLPAVGYLFATTVHASALGIFLSLASDAWYGAYATSTLAWGLTPLEDQQLAGLIMWMPGCLIFPIVAAALLGSWLAHSVSPSAAAGQQETARGQLT